MAAVGTKRKGAASREQQQFHHKRQKVLDAERLLAHPPTKRCKAWQGKAEKARHTLAEAKQTLCFFDMAGSCRDGANCRFLHSSVAAASHCGIIHK